VVQRLLAVPARPPQPRVRNLDARVRPRARDLDLTHLARDLDLDSHRGRFEPIGAFDLDVRVDDTGRAVDIDERAHGCDTRGRPGLDADRLPDPGGGDVDAPVPAEARRHLAQSVVRVVVHMEALAVQCRACMRGRDGRVELDPQLVAPVDEGAPDVEAVRAMLVLGAADLDTVERDGREGVEPLGDELAALRTV